MCAVELPDKPGASRDHSEKAFENDYTTCKDYSQYFMAFFFRFLLTYFPHMIFSRLRVSRETPVSSGMRVERRIPVHCSERRI